jgi:hypothetical protein
MPDLPELKASASTSKTITPPPELEPAISSDSYRSADGIELPSLQNPMRATILSIRISRVNPQQDILSLQVSNNRKFQCYMTRITKRTALSLGDVLIISMISLDSSKYPYLQSYNVEVSNLGAYKEKIECGVCMKSVDASICPKVTESCKHGNLVCGDCLMKTCEADLNSKGELMVLSVCVNPSRCIVRLIEQFSRMKTSAASLSPRTSCVMIISSLDKLSNRCQVKSRYCLTS